MTPLAAFICAGIALALGIVIGFVCGLWYGEQCGRLWIGGDCHPSRGDDE